MSDKLTSNGLGLEAVRSAADHIPVTLSSAQESALAQVRAEAGSIIYDKWPREKQQNAALELLDTATSDQMKADIALIISECNSAESAIQAATASDVDDITDAELEEINSAANVAWSTI